MKLIFFVVLIAFNFGFDNAMHLFQRNLVAINRDKKLLIIGFGGYRNKTYGENGDKKLHIYFKKYYNNFNMAPSLYLTPTINYNNGTKNLKVNISCIPNESESYSFFSCNIENKNESHFIELIQLNDFNFRNESGHINIYANEIELSYLAETTKNNIQVQYDPLSLIIFEFKNRYINNNQVLLYGYLESNSYGNLSTFNWTLYLSENNFKSEYYHNYTQDKNSLDVISFSPGENINDNFNGKIINSTDINGLILIFSNETDDSILYSKYEDSSFELLGFSDYIAPKTDTDARNRAYFKGTINNLKKYMRFTAKIINSTTLRFLEESTNVTAYGIIDTYNIDLKNGLVIYNITYSNTAKYKSIVGMESFHDYEFSDDNITFIENSAQFIYDKENINLTNTENMVIEFFAFNSTNRYESNAFSFDFSIPQTKQKYNISGKGQIFLNYKYMENSTRYEIGCSVVNKSNLYIISCKPEKDVYTLLKTIRIKIPQVQSTDRLRLLDEDGNSTFYAPQTQSGDIQFDYVPQFNTFARKEKKNTGLSAGAIVAIILSSLAVIAAVGLTIFFLNRKPIKSGPKYINDYNNQNSSININK